ncbi:MAG: RidA family protein [Phycisphaerales bacterium]
MSSAIEARLHELGITLPVPAAPVAAYIPSRRAGNLLYISGQVPLRDGTLIAQGPVPRVVPLDLAQQCARQCVINALAAAKAALGGGGALDHIGGVIRVGVFVQCEPGYTEQPKVANGASELLVAVFGESGKHARAAVGSVALPLGAPVEVEVLFEVR